MRYHKTVSSKIHKKERKPETINLPSNFIKIKKPRMKEEKHLIKKNQEKRSKK